ncbi:hypothetical protein HMPREF9599_00450 [Cutibacterium acnes HL050PA2]|nr:hypothetical protein HMPREF9599_00450 [Cutibacterium acnes HL050PA2]
MSSTSAWGLVGAKMIHRLAFKPLDSVVSETPEILTLLGQETPFMWVRRRRPGVAV